MISLIVDGDHQIHRSLHLPKLRSLKNSQGYPTGIIFGVMNVLNNLISRCFDEPVGQVFFLMGKGHANWRREVYADYKKKTQDDIDNWYSTPPGEEFSYNEIYSKSRYALEKHLPHIGIRTISIEDHEADDISYLVVREVLKSQGKAIAASDDGDWLQLVNDPGIPVYRPMKEKLITRQNFQEEMNLPPEAMVLHLSVLGGHDNIPKVKKGFGEKSSLKMIDALEEYTPMEVKKWAEKQTAKTYASLAEEENLRQLRMNIKLVDFSRVPFASHTEQELLQRIHQPTEFNQDMAELFIRKYELNRFAGELLGKKTYKLLS